MNLAPILLAEDNPQDAELALAALARNNLVNRVILVDDGVEALEYLRCEGAFQDRVPGNPAVLLLDLKMPRMDGHEVLRKIRGDLRFKTLPVVMLTSSREERDVIESYGLGVNAYVVKPVDFEDFTEAVQQIAGFWANLNELPSETAT